MPNKNRVEPDAASNFRAKRQFNTMMRADVVRQVKLAAVTQERTASEIMEEAALEWLDRHQNVEG